MISGLMHFGKRAYHSLKTGVPNMDVLITIGASSAFAYSIWGSIISKSIENPENYLFFETAASIFTLVLMGNIIEQRSVKKTGDALHELSALQPETAKRISLQENHEQIEEIPARLIIPGDILLIQTGDRIPADGILIEGDGLLNEALISGESMPIEKIVGNELTGGTINEQGVFKMRALKTGKETVLAGIIELVKKAQSVKPPVQRLGELRPHHIDVVLQHPRRYRRRRSSRFSCFRLFCHRHDPVGVLRKFALYRSYAPAFLPRAGRITLISALHFLQMRALEPSAATRNPIRVALLQAAQTTSTLETLIGISRLRRPPCGFFWLRFMWR
jgi:hypothetical protein